MTKPAKIITYGSLTAFAILAIAVLIRPTGLGANKGIGYYNQTISTLIPHALVYLTLAGTYWMALTKGWLRGVLRFIAVLFIGMLLTPPQWSAPAHLAVASAFISFQMVLSLWFAIKAFNWIDGLLLAIELAAGIAILFAMASTNGYLLHMQLLFQLMFTLLLVRALNAPTGKKILSI